MDAQTLRWTRQNERWKMSALAGGSPSAAPTDTIRARHLAGVLDVMRRRPADSHLQHTAGGALSEMASHNDHNRVEMGGAGCAECIAAAMRGHPSNSELQHSACGALLTLAHYDDNRVKIGAAGGIEEMIFCHARPPYPQQAAKQRMPGSSSSCCKC